MYGDVGHTQEAKKEIISLVDFDNSNVVFETPKPTRLLRRMLQISTQNDNEDLVMDFFAGTGTLQDAIFAQNAEDGGNRKCILVQIPESIFGASAEGAFQKITDIGRERLRKAGERIRQENPLITQNMDFGFRVLKIDTSNMEPVYYSPSEVDQKNLFAQSENIRPGRTSEDLLFQVLLDWGVDLALPIQRETLAGKEVFFVDETALAACFEGGIDEAFVKVLALRKPLRVVFRDSGFADDAAKVNAGQIFKTLSPSTEVKVI